MTPRRDTTIAALLTGLAASASMSLSMSAAAAEAPIDYNRDLRPIFSENCFHCHGPDAGHRKAKLRLDTQEGMLGRGKRARIVVPGRSSESELAHRLDSADEDERMPPPDSGKALSAAQRTLISRWIDQGAPWRPHWSFVPPVRPPLPPLKNASWSRNAIDSFVLARLEQQGLAPSPAADRRTLIRRLFLDLTGLPPPVA